MLPNQNNKLSSSSIIREMPKIEIEIELEDEKDSESPEEELDIVSQKHTATHKVKHCS